MTLLAALASAAPPPDEAAYKEARASFRRGDLKKAEAQIDAALLSFQGSNSYWVWSLRTLRGDVLTSSGHAEEALKVLAQELPAKYANRELMLQRLFALATASYRLNRFEEAEEFFARAADLTTKHLPKLQHEVIFRRGNFERYRGDLVRARKLLQQAVDAAHAAGDRRTEGSALASLAVLFTRLKHYDEAIDTSRRAIALATAVGDASLSMKITGNLGWLYYEVGDLDTATTLLTRADAESVRLGSDVDRFVWQLNFGNIAYKRKDYARARTHYQNAIAIGKATEHRELASAVANLAIVALETGDYATARKFSTEALQLKRKSNLETEAHSLLTDARIAQSTGGYNDAESLYRRAIATADSKSLQWEARARLGQLYALRKKPDLAEEQFRLAIDTVEDARRDLESYELKLSFPTTVIEFYDAYIDFLISRGRAEDALEVAELSRARALERRREGRSIDAKKVARDAGATILSYWLAAPRSYLWVVTAQGVELQMLPKDEEIGRHVAAYQKALRSASGSLARSGQLGQQLYAMLIPPAAAHAIRPGSRVIVIADDQLHALNFETLVTPQQKYWIEDVVVTTAASMQLLAAPHVASSAGSVLLIGNPPPADPAFPPLPRAGEEIQRVAKHFDGRKTVLEGKAATPSAYQRSQPQSFAFIHFVAHGTANLQVPLESAVILARDAESYKLYARDIVEAPLSARLVTISSCHGAGVRAYASEGLVGLAWAFLRAGAQQVVAALWEVNDVATPELMDRMYADIRAGRDPATALRNAKLSMIHSTGVYRKPLYWAPFVLYSGS